MTLIECFDVFAPQNIASCLYLKPEKLIFLGDQAQIAPFLPRYQALLAQRNLQTRLTCRHVALDHIENIVQVLSELLRQEDRCVMDITGGDVCVLLAIGAALAKLDTEKQKKVTVQRFDFLSGTPKPIGNVPPLTGQPVRLQVQELVQLQGGILHPDTPQPGMHHTAADLDSLWALVQQDNRWWNRAISVLREFESRADSENQVFLPLRSIRSSIGNFDGKLVTVRRLLSQLHACGAIIDQSKKEHLEYTYTSPLMRACTQKAGNVLENKVLLEARSLQLQGQPYFHDCHMGVQIDWDGVVHDPKQRIPETRNEVDVVLMRGMVPLFVSCKNGDIGEAELYKLNTVATQFGGPHARKMLVATDLDDIKPSSRNAIVQRGRDMGIHLVTDADTLTKQGWQQIFLDAMGQPAADRY